MADKKHHAEIDVKVDGNVQFSVDGGTVRVKGPKGEISRKFKENFIRCKVEDGRFLITSDSKSLPLKKQLAVMGTVRAHVNNMMVGVTEGFTYKMRIVYAHFPMKATVQGSTLVIDNFLGEKYPRKASILEGVKVEVKGADVILTGTSRDNVSQTAANIEQATKIKALDPRVFQDGIYIVEKAGKPLK